MQLYYQKYRRTQEEWRRKDSGGNTQYSTARASAQRKGKNTNKEGRIKHAKTE